MEALILNTVSFQLTVPTSVMFVNRLLHVSPANGFVRHYAAFLCDRMLQEYGMLRFLPSTIAAAAVFTARRAAGYAPLTGELALHAQAKSCDLSACVQEMRRISSADTREFRTVEQKYSSSKFMRVGKYWTADA